MLVEKKMNIDIYTSTDIDDEERVRAEVERRKAERQQQQRHQRAAELTSEYTRLLRQLELLRDFEDKLARDLRTRRITQAVYDEQQQHVLRQRIEINDDIAVIQTEQKETSGAAQPYVLARRPATVYHERELLTDELVREEAELQTGIARRWTSEQLIAKYTLINQIIDAILLVMLREYDDTELQIKNLKLTETDQTKTKKVRDDTQRTRIAREAYLNVDWPKRRTELEQKRRNNTEQIRRLRLNREPTTQRPIARRNVRGERILFSRNLLEIDDLPTVAPQFKLLQPPTFDDNEF